MFAVVVRSHAGCSLLCFCLFAYVCLWITRKPTTTGRKGRVKVWEWELSLELRVNGRGEGEGAGDAATSAEASWGVARRRRRLSLSKRKKICLGRFYFFFCRFYRFSFSCVARSNFACTFLFLPSTFAWLIWAHLSGPRPWQAA